MPHVGLPSLSTALPIKTLGDGSTRTSSAAKRSDIRLVRQPAAFFIKPAVRQETGDVVDMLEQADKLQPSDLTQALPEDKGALQQEARGAACFGIGPGTLKAQLEKNESAFSRQRKLAGELWEAKVKKTKHYEEQTLVDPDNRPIVDRDGNPRKGLV